MTAFAEFTPPGGEGWERVFDMEGRDIPAGGSLPLSCEPVYLHLSKKTEETTR